MNRVFNLFLKNVRAGFATNSSSTHSLVFYNQPVEGKVPNRPEEGYEFGWGNFSISKKIDKLVYGILSQSRAPWITEEDTIDNLRELEVERIREHLPKNITKEEFEEAKFTYLENRHAYVDHQSLPGRLEGEELEEYLELITRDDVAIYGGNDNGGKGAEDFLFEEGVEATRRMDNYTRDCKIDFYASDREDDIAIPSRPISEKLDVILSVKFNKDLDDIINYRHYTGRYPDIERTDYLYEQWKNFPETNETIKTIQKLREYL